MVGCRAWNCSPNIPCLGEGVRGSLSKAAIANYKLDKDSDFQKFGLGIKELWQVDPDKHKPGYVQHTLGWPLDNKTGGGSWLYHFGDNFVSIGFVTHLNYQNPHLSPYDEFQRFKMHPAIKPLLEGGKRVSYGARAITEGGYQSVPKLAFPAARLSAVRPVSSMCRALKAVTMRWKPALWRQKRPLKRCQAGAAMMS